MYKEGLTEPLVPVPLLFSGGWSDHPLSIHHPSIGHLDIAKQVLVGEQDTFQQSVSDP
jgi:hypothetical protein